MPFVVPHHPISNAADSAVIVDAEVQVPDNPFSFFFGHYRTTGPIEIGTQAPALPSRTIHHGGTGFIVDGQLLTAAHVVVPEDGGTLTKVTLTNLSGSVRESKVLRIDKKSDLAELDRTVFAPSLLLSAQTPKRNDVLTEIGHPAMIRFVVSKGLLIGFDRSQGYNIAALDTFHGNSGGPVLNKSGEVVGMAHTLISGSRFTGIGTLQALRDFIYPDETR